MRFCSARLHSCGGILKLEQACLRGMLRVVEERCSRPISLSSSRHVRLSSFSSLSAAPATSCTTHYQTLLQSPISGCCDRHYPSGFLVSGFSGLASSVHASLEATQRLHTHWTQLECGGAGCKDGHMQQKHARCAHENGVHHASR